MGSFILAHMVRLACITGPRRNNGIKLLLAVAALCISPLLVLAQGNDAWISDQFDVVLRTEKKITPQNFIAVLLTGAKVTILEQDEESDYTRVRTSDGKEGWLLARFLISSPTARQQLPQVQTRLANSEERGRELQARIRELEQGRRELQTQLGKTESSSRGLQEQLDEIREMSTDAIQLDDQNKRLKQQLIDNERHIDDIESENRRLLARSNREWFIVGAAVVTFGIILGLIIPRMRWQKKSSWGDF